MKNLEKKGIALLLVIFTLCALPSLAQENTNAESSYQQYGTPFSEVPDPEDVAIYQVNIRSFSEEGNLKGVEARLDEIDELGVNVIYLMPIYPVGKLRSAGGDGSPYAVKDYKAVNPEFGTLEDLRSLVSEAHKRGIAVMLDWVANHTSWDNSWITEHKDRYQQDESGDIIIPPNTNWQDVAQLNYGNPEMRAAMLDALKYWVYNANIDGFRFDAANWVPFSFWKKAVEELRAIDSHQLLLLAEGDREDHFKAGFDYVFGFNIFYQLKDQVFKDKKPVAIIDSVNNYDYSNVIRPSQRVVRYVSNHDVSAYEGTPVELFESKRGAMATFVAAAYMKSVPMIYNGQEIGYPKRLEFFTSTPIDWSNADEEILEEYKSILEFYNESNAIRRGDIASYSTDNLAVFIRKYQEEQVLVIANLRDKEVEYKLPSELQGSSWQNVFDKTRLKLKKQISLAPFSYLVLKNQK